MTQPPPRIKLFDNQWVEKLTVISAPAFIVLWGLGLGVLAWMTVGMKNVDFPLLIFVAGIATWTLVEYALHRFVFHWQPRSRMMQQFVFVMHGNHHASPNDPLRNLMPPVVSVPLAGICWSVIVLLFGPAGNWLFLGGVVGYVSYDLIHYATHQWPMQGRLARMLKVHHMRHHHSHEVGNYAITAIFWDRFFGSRLARADKG